MCRRYKGFPYDSISLNRLFLLVLFTIGICLPIIQTTPVFAQDDLYETIVDTPVITAEWSPDGTLLAVGTTTGARIYNQQLQENGTLPNANERIVSLSWDPTSTRLAGVLYPHDRLADPAVPPTMVSSLLIWRQNPDNSFTLQYQKDYPGANNITNVTWSPNGQMLAASEEERVEGTLTFIGRITVWDTTHWRKISETKNTYDAITKPVWSPDSSTIASSGIGLCLKLTGCRTDEAEYFYVYFLSNPLTGDRISFENIDADVYLAWSPNNQLAIVYGALQTLDLNSHQSYVYEDYRVPVVKAAWLPDSNLLLQIYPDEVRQFNPVTSETIAVYPIPNLKYVTVTPDGNATIITNDNHISIRTIEIFATPTGTPMP